MALVLGTNCGFVTEAPTDDPEGATTVTCDYKATALKVTSPAGATKVTEIGWYSGTATQAANTQVGIYDHNSGDNNPENLLGSSGDFAKGTGAGWKVATGLDITIDPETIYWIAFQLDNTATASKLDISSTAGEKLDSKTSQTALTNPWGISGEPLEYLGAIYAVYEAEAPTGTNMQINIGDVWKAVPSAQINIGDTWKPVASAKVNIGDTWKTIF